ncbi:hypothetical protein VQL36_18465 [Chengkuizengella sp. SCS-71B]|uniref:hypothetical protein n=1 Tax=Chengkuizengella sp. SCS-71B TaxID=3115290 RepID=UPI0032C2485F
MEETNNILSQLSEIVRQMDELTKLQVNLQQQLQAQSQTDKFEFSVKNGNASNDLNANDINSNQSD